MSALKDLIETVGLDQTFFYQFVIIAVLYFVAKKLFLQKYHQDAERRRKSTEGSFVQSKEMEEKVEQLEKDYAKKAHALNKNFQEVFSHIKNRAEEKFNKDKAFLETEQKSIVKNKSEQLLKSKDEEEQKLEKDIPQLVQSLVDKLAGRA